MKTTKSREIALGNFVYFVVFFLIIFFFTSEYIVVASLCTVTVLVLVVLRKDGKLILKSKIVMPFLGLCFYNLIFVFFGSNRIAALTEVLRMILYIIVILLLTNIEIKKQFYDSVWQFFFFVCVVIQVVQFFHLFDIDSVFSSFYYNSWTEMQLTKYTSLKNFRSGSIFLSENNFFKMVCIMSAISLNNILNDYCKTKNTLFLFLSFISAVFTGSRTCFLILSVQLVLFFFNSLKRKSLKPFWLFSPFLLCFSFLFFYDSIISFVSNSRFFQIGKTYSLDYKFVAIKTLLSYNSISNSLFGRGPYSIIDNPLLFMDSDMGNLLSYYGFVFGIVFGIAIIHGLFIYVFERDGKRKRLFNIMCLFMVIMSMITSGVLLNYRVFSLILIAILPVVHDEFEHEIPVSR